MFKQFWLNFQKKIQKRYRKFREGLHNTSVINRWHKAGNPYPTPHEYRQETLKQYATKFGLDTLVETGTYMGKMPEALQDDFARIYTIEVNIDHYLNAKEKFYALPHIETIKGESGEQLELLVAELAKPSLFWLDTHASLEKGLQEISILKELKAILGSTQNHVILINDARLFTGEKGYPSLVELRNYIVSLKPLAQFEVENDIIRVWVPVPAQSPVS